MKNNTKICIFGDIHGRRLIEFDNKIENDNIDIIVCLGDFDLIETIHEYMDFEKKYLKAGKKVITVPGNHDEIISNSKIYLEEKTIFHY
ncbi:metallophosphoesterase [Candidatus Latescibacterota bacterium]